ncbi:MAG: anti-sigma factor [Planctomycetes bacterium]|nr:anti-sigma factor [Planctomycetota bacterium]
MHRPLRDRPEGPEEDRLFDLMRERAVHGLEDDELRELNRLAALHADVDVECYDRTAAALDLVFSGRRCPPLPEELKRRIASTAPRAVGAAVRPRPSSVRVHSPPDSSPSMAPVPPPPTRRANWPAWSGWIAATAAALVAVLGWTREPAPPDPTQVARVLQREVDAAPDCIVLPWKPTEDPDGRAVSGDLHWSTALQKGYMRFRGLPANDPAQKQYQLWIFDEPRGTDHPVDGGVFDVVGGEVVIPIDAKIRVNAPALFAVTAEPPGGVVVSKREHIISLAQL